MKTDKQWRTAIDKEIKTHEEHGTWTPAFLPNNKDAIDTRWVFRTKQNGMKKARLVAKGYQEEQTYNVYAPVARMSSIRMICLKYVTEKNVADVLTKPLCYLKFLCFKEMLRIKFQ